MNDRIKLAEAMGWKRDHPDSEYFWPPNNYRRFASSPDTYHILGLPDPFTDANDDYAVLEWMRNDDSSYDINRRWISYVDLDSQFHYQVGDYARAALKVLS